MEKIKVNKEVYVILNEILGDYRYTKESIMNHHKKGWETQRKLCLNALSNYEMAQALFVGYELELNPHEILFNRYKELEFEKGLISISAKNNIKWTLDVLGIKIKGINKEEL